MYKFDTISTNELSLREASLRDASHALLAIMAVGSFQSHQLLFSHASAEVRDENTPERKFASTEDRTHNHQVMSPTRSPLSHPGGAGLRKTTFYIFYALESIATFDW